MNCETSSDPTTGVPPSAGASMFRATLLWLATCPFDVAAIVNSLLPVASSSIFNEISTSPDAPGWRVIVLGKTETRLDHALFPETSTLWEITRSARWN